MVFAPTQVRHVEEQALHCDPSVDAKKPALHEHFPALRVEPTLQVLQLPATKQVAQSLSHAEHNDPSVLRKNPAAQEHFPPLRIAVAGLQEVQSAAPAPEQVLQVGSQAAH